MKNRIYLQISLLLMSTLMLSSPISVNADDSAPFVSNEISDIVKSTADLFQERYLNASLGQAMSDRLIELLESGAFDETPSRADLAAAIQRELRAVQDDKHIQINFRSTPPQPAKPLMQTASPEMMVNGPRRRSGIRELKLLEGGVGYLRIANFSQDDLEAGLFDASMRFLASSDAIIVDLRDNGGGSSRAQVELMTSFLGSEPVRIGTIESSGRSTELWSKPREDQSFIDEAPLYILIDEGSSSAAEATAYHLKHLGRATIVGKRSDGAGNLSATIALEIWDDAGEVQIGSYTLILPKAEITNVNTGRSWEGVGVVPDIEVEADRALGEAHALAIAAAHPNAPWAEAMIASVRASYWPTVLTSDQLARLAGSYEGERVYRVRNGRLFTASGDGAELELISITATSFRYKSGISATVQFDLHADGTVEAARIIFADGGFERFARLN